MPELPEVEVVRRGLVDHLAGRHITAVSVLDPRSLRRHVPGAQDFVARMTGRQVLGVARRGKYLWWQLDDDDAVLCHLGMSGQFRISLPNAEPIRHERLCFDLDDGSQLRFADQRIFGGMSFSQGGADLPTEIAHIASDPLEDQFDLADFDRRIRAKRTTVKRALLDQTLISGIGNIYADEALWRAQLHYERTTRGLARHAVSTLVGHVVNVMNEALAAGGTSFDRLYVNVNGTSGYFSRNLDVYGREGQACKRCDVKIVRERFMNRSSYFCPRCQRRPRRTAESVR